MLKSLANACAAVETTALGSPIVFTQTFHNVVGASFPH